MGQSECNVYAYVDRRASASTEVFNGRLAAREKRELSCRGPTFACCPHPRLPPRGTHASQEAALPG